MAPAEFRDIPSADIPSVKNVKIIAGSYGGVNGPIHGGPTDPYYLDVHLEAGATFETALPTGHNAFVYAYDGEASIAGKALPHRAAGLLSDGETVEIKTDKGARVLVLAGKPIREPVVQYGPFVMNTRAEIEQAIADYQAGRLSKENIRRLKIA